MSIKSRLKNFAPNRTSRSLRNTRGLRVESLERRECPAVVFEFSPDSGMLKITGDEGPNNVDIITTDRTVQVSGDGQHRSFRGVSEVFVDTGRGDDRIQTRQTSIVVDFSRSPLAVTSRIHSGPGDDVIKISDFIRNTGANTSSLISSPLSAEIDLGVGSDEVVVQLNHHDSIDLDLTSDDGDDVIEVSPVLLIPAVQKSPIIEVDLDLGGGGNLVDVSVENFDDVDLNIKAAGGGNTVRATTSVNSIEAGLKVNLDLAGFNNSTQGSHLYADGSVRFITYSIGSGPLFATRSSLGSKIHFESSLPTGSKHPTVEFDAVLGDEDDSVTLKGSSLKFAKTSLHTGGGDDLIDWSFINNGTDAAVDAVIDSGAGNDEISFLTRDLPSVKLDLNAGTEDDFVRVDSRGELRGRSWAGQLDLGEGNNKLDLKAKQFRQVTADLRSGGGEDSMWVDVSGQPIVAGVRSQLIVMASLGAGSDQFHLKSQGFHDFETTINTGPRGDGQDVITTQHMIQPPRCPVSRITRSPDGRLDQATFVAIGYRSHNVSQIGDTGTHEIGHWVGQ